MSRESRGGSVCEEYESCDCEGARKASRMHGTELRWLVVFKRCHLNHDWLIIKEDLHISLSTLKRIVECYEKTGAVSYPSWMKRGRPRSLNSEQTMELVKRVLDAPSVSLAIAYADMLSVLFADLSMQLLRTRHSSGWASHMIGPCQEQVTDDQASPWGVAFISMAAAGGECGMYASRLPISSRCPPEVCWCHSILL